MKRVKMAKSRAAAPVTWAQATRDIVVAAINKGQLPILGVFGFLMLVVFKLPETEVAVFAREVIDSLKNGALLGYLGWGGTLTGWLFHARYMRKQFSEEYERMGLAKSAAQSAAAGVDFKSSD